MHRRAQLEQLLRAHRPFDAAEHAHRARMLALLDVAGDPFTRAHFAPGHFTASGFVLAPEGDALLLIHHRKLERWLQPGGHVESTDAGIEAAARRELREEVGLDQLPLAHDGIFNLDVHTIPVLGAEPAHEHFDVRFLFRAASRQLGSGDDLETARWIVLSDIATAGSDQSVLRAVDKLRSGGA